MVDYTLTELMAVAAAREIRDGEVVFAGTGLPMLGAMLAQRTHAPQIAALSLKRAQSPASSLIYRCLLEIHALCAGLQSLPV